MNLCFPVTLLSGHRPFNGTTCRINSQWTDLWYFLVRSRNDKYILHTKRVRFYEHQRNGLVQFSRIYFITFSRIYLFTAFRYKSLQWVPIIISSVRTSPRLLRIDFFASNFIDSNIKSSDTTRTHNEHIQCRSNAFRCFFFRTCISTKK